MKAKVLMHMCCAPCAIYPIESLENKGYQIDGLYFNPNIHPIEEFEKREEYLEKLATMKNFKVFYKQDYKEDLWQALKDKDLNRCLMCYELRLNETFKFAKENNYDYVTTSLLVSPYQQHNLIIQIANKLSKKYKIEFLYEDFRIGYKEGQKKAKELGIYCQRYCGCILSLKERLQEITSKIRL